RDRRSHGDRGRHGRRAALEGACRAPRRVAKGGSMTPIFDTETDGYLERLGQTLSTGGWSDVLRRSRRRERRTRILRTAVVVGGAAAAAAGVVGGLGV